MPPGMMMSVSSMSMPLWLRKASSAFLQGHDTVQAFPFRRTASRVFRHNGGNVLDLMQNDR
jgi:hypothetical protein